MQGKLLAQHGNNGGPAVFKIVNFDSLGLVHLLFTFRDQAEIGPEVT